MIDELEGGPTPHDTLYAELGRVLREESARKVQDALLYVLHLHPSPVVLEALDAHGYEISALKDWAGRVDDRVVRRALVERGILSPPSCVGHLPFNEPDVQGSVLAIADRLADEEVIDDLLWVLAGVLQDPIKAATEALRRRGFDLSLISDEHAVVQQNLLAEALKDRNRAYPDLGTNDPDILGVPCTMGPNWLGSKVTDEVDGPVVAEVITQEGDKVTVAVADPEVADRVKFSLT